ncbi:MAG TPA: pepsin/retropepsin-like aspartic protease family protein [Tepidisphaeraceae bacterium]|nr:pepsin/retropepsin-like aspartic protease family protein [Tepidisphaeraceae bacterium]
MRFTPFPCRALAALLILLSCVTAAFATDIEGVQPAALDQPRINLLIRRGLNQPPLTGKAEQNALLQLMEPDAKPKQTFNIQAFLDTGASGVVLSANTAKSLKITSASLNGAPIVFHDVGVAGGDTFHVSEPLYLAMAAFHPGTDTDDPARDYRQQAGPIRAQVGPLGGGGLLEMMVGGLDVAGMPVMTGKVAVIDPKPVNGFDDTMRAYLYKPGTRFNPAQAKRDPGIPPVNRHVRLSYASFARFTHTTPANALGPTIVRNPFIGPDPTSPTKPAGPVGITIAHNGKTSQGSWLLDTGAAASLLSTQQAAAVGIRYRPGTEGTATPILDGVPQDQQFTLTVGGIGGQRKSAGFYLNELRVPTTEGDILIYRPAPVLVCDITVEDAKTQQRLTLDGVFGMNFLAASAKIGEGLLPDIGKLTEGPFEWIVFDEPNALLGLQLRP